ncbi:MAG: hypothetical protein HYV34_00595 [Candidatus Kerfeldbacteria bacterium]|nr:hypothetical protein [Candidatus Kerfeldbacteria bacterium]
MTTIETWGELLVGSFQDLWLRFISLLPELLAALIVFIAGWLIAMAIERVVVLIVEKLWIEKLAERVKLNELLVFLLAASDILGLSEVTQFLNRVLLYVPNVVVAVLILLLGIIFGRFAERVVHGSLQAAKFASAGMLAGLAKWMITVFAILAALIQLKIAETMLNTLFTGFVAMIALAGGLAFGLGGREEAQRALQQLKSDISRRHGPM